MNTIKKQLEKIKAALPATDVLTYEFSSEYNAFALVYADGLVNKEFLGDLVARPLLALQKQATKADVKAALLFPEIKDGDDFDKVIGEILDGNAALLFGDGKMLVVGAKAPPTRAVIEPPTGVSVKGPREGFVEDIKINLSLLRKRLKSPDLLMQDLKVGKRSQTNVSIVYLKGIADEKTVKKLQERIQKTELDILPDSSYLADLIAPRRHSIFCQVGTTEKPDIFAAKLAEGRVGILVDGSPVALTVPFFLTENFQSADDYFTSPFFATTLRVLRLIACIVALLLPAFYVSSQLFKQQLLPLGLTLTIASSIQGLPLSPSLEMFLVLFVLEVIKEASIRMPKYVGMALSIVGALVLGETAVSAGFVSTPAIIIVAFSGICLYVVPDFTETGTLLRWIFLIVAGSFGPFGLVVAIGFTLYYLISEDGYGAPLLAPFAPLISGDLKDALVKYNLRALRRRPKTVGSKNKTRLKQKQGENE